MGLFEGFKRKRRQGPEERRAGNNAYIKQMGIACLDKLPLTESSSAVKLKDTDTICKRAIACLLSIQLACDISENRDVQELKALLLDFLKKFQVEEDLLDNERRLFDGSGSQQDAVNVAWTYECYWSLIWALGLIEDAEMKVPSSICDCAKAIDLVADCQSFAEFKARTRVRDVEEILDMLDLYYRYHWACVEKSLRPETNIADLNPEVVWERRKGLEWLVSELEDWDEISLDT